MASQTSQTELLAIALSGQENMVTAAEEREQERPHTFLSLAPTTSASYPVKSTTPNSPASPAVPSATLIDSELKTRRSSSTTSDGSLMQKRRFLKLGPVHHGEGGGDWSEEVVE